MVQAPAGMEIIGAMRTDTGLVRSHNEDAVAWVTSHDDAAATNRGSLALVADGMGGHAAGEVASALAAANRAIIEYAQEHPECRGMGTTCTVLAFRDSQAWLAHIGDSRAYLLRDRRLTQLSEDQTLVAKLVSEGTITQAEADQSPMHNVILQALGTTANIKPMIGAKGLPLQSGDVLILCSDGVSNLVPDGKIAEVASRLPPAATTTLRSASSASRPAPRQNASNRPPAASSCRSAPTTIPVRARCRDDANGRPIRDSRPARRGRHRAGSRRLRHRVAA